MKSGKAGAAARAAKLTSAERSAVAKKAATVRWGKMTRKSLDKEIEDNLEYFQKELPKIDPANHGKHALIRHQDIVGFYDTVTDAVTAGNAAYSDNIFSVQQVTDEAVNLGFYSHAVLLSATQ